MRPPGLPLQKPPSRPGPPVPHRAFPPTHNPQQTAGTGDLGFSRWKPPPVRDLLWQSAGANGNPYSLLRQSAVSLTVVGKDIKMKRNER